jgi:Zn-finger nucleic acid-binding protein
MSAPQCPSCREPMSPVEAGMVGVWNCIYCEGAWLPSSESNKVVPRRSPDAQVRAPVGLIVQPPGAATLLCPECGGLSFMSCGTAGHLLHSCESCQSVFLPKASVAALAESIGGRGWEVHRAIGELLGGRPVAKADAAVTAAAAIYLLLS